MMANTTNAPPPPYCYHTGHTSQISRSRTETTTRWEHPQRQIGQLSTVSKGFRAPVLVFMQNAKDGKKDGNSTA